MIREIVDELDYMGLNDIRIVAPETVINTSPYLSYIMSNSTIASRVDHIGVHEYGEAGQIYSSYPPRNYWLTEGAAWCELCDNGVPFPGGEWAYVNETGDIILGTLLNGFSTFLIWDWLQHQKIILIINPQ